MDTGRSKCQHLSDTLDSDKDNPQPTADTMLALITPIESHRGWINVEKKKGWKS